MRRYTQSADSVSLAEQMDPGPAERGTLVARPTLAGMQATRPCPCLGQPASMQRAVLAAGRVFIDILCADVEHLRLPRLEGRLGAEAC